MVAMTTSLILIGHYQAAWVGCTRHVQIWLLVTVWSVCCIKLIELVDSHLLLCGQDKSAEW